MFSFYATKLNFTADQGRNIEFNFDALIHEGVIGYAVVPTEKVYFF